MIRSSIIVAILVGATFFVPVWMLLVLYGVALFFTPHRWLLVIPAVLFDAWYAPSHSLTFSNNRMLVIVLGMIIVFSVGLTTTRISQRYGLEKK